MLCYTQSRVPTDLNFPWDHSQPQLTHCSGSNQDVFPSGDGLFFLDSTHVNLSVCCSVQGLAPWLQFWSEHFCWIRLIPLIQLCPAFCLGWFQSLDLFFYFLLSSTFFPTIGYNRRAGSMSQLVCGKSSLEGPGQLTTRILWNIFSQPSPAKLWINHPVVQLWTVPLSSQYCCTWKDGAPDVSCFLFQLVFPMLLNIFSRPLGEKKVLW